MNSNLIILATYWNEKYFVKASLEQIDEIDPIEVIICDGCFDPKRPLHSTDGTYEILKNYVEERKRQGKHAQLISPQRKSFLGAFFSLLHMNNKDNPIHMLKPSRWRLLYYSLPQHPYRRNQAITFNFMISKSKLWKEGRWFMTYDSDQFYSDDLIGKLKITNEKTEYGLLTACEKTFFKDFFSYTDEYAIRTWNNMPHKIYRNTILQLTRNMAIECLFRRRAYVEVINSKHIGTYFHYKLPRTGRFEQSYQVGDRKKPPVESYRFKEFTGEHPSVIQKYFGEELKIKENTKKEKKTLLISIVMSVYNGQKHLAESIESILSQTYKDFEFIIVDDASTDNSLKILKQYEKDDKRIKIVENKSNIGLTKSLNKAINYAKGRYIARQDADDFSEENRLDLQSRFLEKKKHIFLCGTGFSVVDNKSELIGKISKEMKPSDVEKNLKKMNCLCGSFIFRNDKNTFYREKFFYSHDYDLYLILLTRGKKLANMKEVLYNYRLSSSAISELHGKTQFLFAKKAKEFYLERLRFKKDSYDNFNPEELIKLGKKSKRFISTDYLVIIALLGSNKTLARKKIISVAIKNKKVNLLLIKHFIKTFIPKIWEKEVS